MTLQQATPDIRAATNSRWRSPILLALFTALSTCLLSALLPFLSGGALPGGDTLRDVHYLWGLVLFGPYVIYQFRHLRRVRPHYYTLKFWLGLASMTTLLLTGLTGAQPPTGSVRTLHILSGFVFVAVLISHLSIVTRPILKENPLLLRRVIICVAIATVLLTAISILILTLTGSTI